MNDRSAPVAAFDVDGTLIDRDSFVRFLMRVDRGATLAGAVRHLPALVAGALSDRRRDAAKAAMVHRVLGGRTLAAVEEEGRAHAEQMMSWVRPAMVDTLLAHRRRGHPVVLVSASLEVYLRPFAERLGADGVVGTRLAVDDAGVLTGEMVGVNMRRREKAAALRRWMEDRGFDHLGWAYGDSTGDVELLAAADFPTLLRTR